MFRYVSVRLSVHTSLSCRICLTETDKSEWACIGSKCYRYLRDNLAWSEASERCKSFGSSAKLATMQSKAQNDFVKNLLLEDAWLGLNDIWEAGIFYVILYSAHNALYSSRFILAILFRFIVSR